MVVLPEPVGPVQRKNATRAAADLAGHFGQADLLEGEDLVGDFAEHERAAAFLLEDGDTEAGLGSVGEAKVAGTLFFVFLLDSLGRDRLHQGDGVFGLEHLGLKLAKMGVETERGRSSDGQMEVDAPPDAVSRDDRFELKPRVTSFGPSPQSAATSCVRGECLFFLTCRGRRGDCPTHQSFRPFHWFVMMPST